METVVNALNDVHSSRGRSKNFLGTGGNFLYDGSPVFWGSVLYVATVRLQFTKVSYTVNQIATTCALSSL